MAVNYSVDVCNKLKEKFIAEGLHRPQRIDRYDAGTELVYNLTSMENSHDAEVRLRVEKFIGGGFAGQVYQVTILDIDDSLIAGLHTGGVYAMKILVPPSNRARLFRNVLYWLGFQGPFQLQVNPAAARASGLWQKFIRRASRTRFGDERAVVDVYATFVDGNLGSCGELSEWVEGRTWRLEVDDHLDVLKLWQKGKQVKNFPLGSDEYRAKKQFMKDFVNLLHDMGAYEFARQYEWSTCKSQPNCLKRRDTDTEPTAGLTAVDFKAGLTLLPFLPMSPGDFKLIRQGVRRGSLVQFDKGDIKKLDAFVTAHESEFADMQSMLDELKATEMIYRNSIPDITHNHIRLLYSGRLWSTILDSAITGWRVRNLVDSKNEQRLRGNKLLTVLFFIIGVIPFLGKVFRRIWARPDWRKHYGKILTSSKYLKRTVRGKIAEKAISWYRDGRIEQSRSLKLPESLFLYLCHLPFLILPAPLHKFLTDGKYAKQRLAYFFVRPVRLYFNAHLREQWLHDMVAEGKKKHMVSDEDAEIILSQIKEPFIQKYLISLVVHFLTWPVTQIVSIIVSWIYVRTHPELSKGEAGVAVAGILILFQIIPISPGSLVRGLYVVYMAIKDRSFKDYNIAIFLGFVKYIGYLAFPIQMTYHYPALARFMAGHWATEAVHIVPVFGERGALLEHWVFNLFYNWPLTIRRRMRKRAQLRASIKPRYRHIILSVLSAVGIFALLELAYLGNFKHLPGLRNIWYLVVFIIVPLVSGSLVTLGCGGAALWKRIVAASISALVVAVLYTGCTYLIAKGSVDLDLAQLAKSCVWRAFIFTILSAFGAIFTELKLPDHDLKATSD